MKKRQRVILLSSLLLASSLALTINYAFCSPFIRDNAGSINIGITGIALGDKDYYVFFGDGDKQALEKGDDGKYTTNITVDTAKDYSYKITDKFGNPKYKSDTFNLGITGTFNLSFDTTDTTNLTSSLTYSFSLVDEGNAFNASNDALPYCSFSSAVVNPTDYYILGNIASKPEGITGSWDKESGVRMTTNPDNENDRGMAKHVYLEKGDSFKLVCDYFDESGAAKQSYYGTGRFTDGDAVNDFKEHNSDPSNLYEGGNIEVTADSGYYDIYFSSEYKITISKSASQEAEPIKIQAASYDDGTKTTTYTLDATKYASASTYISFSDNGNTKGTQSIAVSDLITTNSTLTMKKYLYLDVNQNLGNGGWYNESATFKALISDTEYPMRAYGTVTNFYQLSTPLPTSIESVNFKRYSADGTEYWNCQTGDQTLVDNYVFKINGWNSAVASSYSGAPEFIVEKNS